MIQYGKAGEQSQMSGNKSMAENEVIEIDGKRYTKVQIEDHNEEFLMDEDNKIYDMNLQLVGVQGDSDEDDNFWYWIDSLF